MKAVALLAALALLGVAPPLKPTPEPTEAPLREIGRVRATTPLCKTLATRASAAADIAFQDDRTITVTLSTLRTIDFDKNIIVKSRGTNEFRREYAALRAGAVQGDGEMKKFREALKAVTSDEQRAELSKFADALAGVISRQKKLAEAMGRYLAWLDAQESLTDQQRSDTEKNIMLNLGNANVAHNPFGDYNNMPETLSHASKRAADELEIRATSISRDEDTAADRIDPAFKGC